MPERSTEDIAKEFYGSYGIELISPKPRCQAQRSDSVGQCEREASRDSQFCWQHGGGKKPRTCVDCGTTDPALFRADNPRCEPCTITRRAKKRGRVRYLRGNVE